MNPRFLAGLALGLLAASGEIVRAETAAAVTPVTRVVLSEKVFVECGMARARVETMFGAPSTRLSADVWIYWKFRPTIPVASAQQDTLVVIFAGERVSSLKLVRRETVLMFLAARRAHAGEIVAAK
jgi:hypothetical protein